MNSSIFLYRNIKYGQEYDLFTDGELIKEFNMGNDQALGCMLKRYLYVIRRIVNSFYIISSAKDDMLQESIIGLFKAMKSYDEKYEISFKTYVEICVRRKMISAFRKSKKYEENNIIPVYNCSDNENHIMEKLCDNSFNPENIFISEEEKSNNIEFATLYLSEYEKSVFNEYRTGKSYKEIAEALNTNLKSVDNALQRVRKKINNKTTYTSTKNKKRRYL